MNEVKRSARRKSAGSHRSGGTASRDDSESRWNRIKGRLAAKVGQMDKETLRAALLACGIGVTIVAALVAVIKSLPIGVTVLALLGLGLALRFWERLRYLPRPF